MSIIKCPECGNNVSDKADKCIHCGFPIYMKVNMSIEQKKCLFCGALNDGYESICKSCGAQLNKLNIPTDEKTDINIEENQVLTKKKNKTTALLLCIFLGFFGAHKFYEGKPGMGILYLCTGGLFYIGWIVDIITISLKTDY